MRLIEGTPPFMPRKCLVSGSQEGVFVDFEATYTANCDPRVYLRAGIVERAAVELLGMVPKAEVDALKEQLAAAQARLAEFGERVEAFERFAEAFGADPAIGVGAGVSKPYKEAPVAS